MFLRLSIFFVFIITSLQAFSKEVTHIQDLFEYSHNIVLDSTFVLTHNHLIAQQEDKSYILKRDLIIDGNSEYLDLLVFKNSPEGKKYRLSFPDTLDWDYGPGGIAANKKHIFIMYHSHILIYSAVDFKLQKSISTKGYYFKKLTPTSKYLFGVSYYTGTNKGIPHPPSDIIVFKLDLTSFEFRIHYFPTPKNKALLKFSNRRLLAFSDELIVYSHMSDYKLDFYDLDFNLQNSASKNVLLSNVAILENNEIKDKKSRTYVRYLMEHSNEISLIESIYFLNNKLFVNYSIPDGEESKEYLFDVIEFNKFDWKYKYENLQNYKYDDLYENTDKEKFDFNRMTTSHSIFIDNTLLTLSTVSNYPSRINGTFGEYKEKWNNSYNSSEKLNYLIYKMK